MSQNPPYPPDDSQSGWGQQPPPPGGGQQPPPPGWGQQPPPPPGGPYGGGPGGPYGGPPASFEPTQAVSYGWRAFQLHAGPLLGVTAVVILIPVLIQVIGGWVSGGEAFSFAFEAGEDPSFDFNALALGFNLLGSVVGLVLSAVMVRMVLDIVDGNTVDFGAAFSRINVAQVVIAGILIGVATTIGIMLCVLPGLAVAVLTLFANYFIVGKDQDAISAIRSSISLISANFGKVLLFVLLAAACLLAGVLACCVGMLVAYPVVTVATGYAFRMLQHEPVRPV